jgi:aryl-alcohol dehydrogenase-like predicted oxidoreductase
MKKTVDHMMTRREATKLSLLAGMGLAGGGFGVAYGDESAGAGPIATRPIPKTGEQLAVVGVGTNRFGVQEEDEIAPLREVIQRMVDNGANVIDTARGYGGGRAEEVISQIVDELDVRDEMFIATKVGTPASREAALGLLEASLRALEVEQVAAMRAHSVDGAEILFPILREWKEAGRIRYFGVTTVSDARYPDIERQIREENLDIIEIDYSVVNRSAAERVLPLAQDHGVAVLVAVPFGGRAGNVLSHVANRPLPDFASEIGAASWAQLCLKYNLSHPAVTVVIPGTTNPLHMIDNLGAGRGELPDADLRRRIEQIFDDLS